MGLTKRDKDFWLDELKEELKKKLAVFQPAIDRCMGLARVKGMKVVGLEKDWIAIGAKFKKIVKTYKEYLELKDEMDELVELINDKLEPYTYERPQYGRTYIENVKVNWTGPSYHGIGAANLGSGWIDDLARCFLDEVMVAEGVTEPMEIAEVEKKLERNIMLATSAAQLKEFLEAFMQDNGIEV